MLVSGRLAEARGCARKDNLAARGMACGKLHACGDAADACRAQEGGDSGRRLGPRRLARTLLNLSACSTCEKVAVSKRRTVGQGCKGRKGSCSMGWFQGKGSYEMHPSWSP